MTGRGGGGGHTNSANCGLFVNNSFPTPNIWDVLERLSESKVFSTLGAQNAYHCISIEEKSMPLTAFMTACGLYQFCRLPFGLKNKNAGVSYCLLVSNLIEYLDDLLLHTQDVDSHLKLLRLVLQAHRESGI